MNKKIMTLAVLLVAVVSTGFQVSGTYAKYTTTEKFSDSARVAHWNFYSVDGEDNQRTDNTIDLFRESYTCVTGGECVFNTQLDNKNLVAPGAYGSYTFSLVGETEVAYKLVVKAEDEDGLSTIVNGVRLYEEDGITLRHDPIEFSFDADYTTTFSSDELVEQLQAQLNLFADANDVFHAGDMSQEVTLYWRWNYSVNDATDELDTELGNMFVAGLYDPEITIDLTITAVQAEIDQTL